jgi:hypothetical protein
MKYYSFVTLFFWSTLLFCCVFGFGGCTDDYQPMPQQDQALSSHISILSVARWDDYSYWLQPQFSLTPSEALTKALTNTADISSSSVDSLTAAFQAGYSEGSTSSSTTQPAAATQPSTPTATTLPSVFTTPVQIDPFLQYQAATALYQEVAMINRYVRDAAIGDEYEPYVVHLQVSVMPGRRDTDLDVYTLISFFLDENSIDNDDLKIVPLLVTDEIEAASESNSDEQVRALQLALEAAYKGVGASGSIDSLNQSINNILDNNINSTFSVAQASENTLKVRFAAVQNGASYQLIAQPHDVTILLLVPRKALGGNSHKVLACSLTSYVNPESGTSFRETRDQLMDKIGEVMLDYSDASQDLDPNYGDFGHFVSSRITPLDLRRVDALKFASCIKEALKALIDNNYAEFCKGLKENPQDPQFRINAVYFPFLWDDLVDILSHSPYDISTFNLPIISPPVILPNQNPVLVDNGKYTETSIAVQNAESIIRDGDLQAWITIFTNTQGSLNIPMTDQWVNNSSQLYLAFPSLKLDGFEEAKSQGGTPSSTTNNQSLDFNKILLNLKFTLNPNYPQPGNGWDQPSLDKDASLKNIPCIYVPPSTTTPSSSSTKLVSVSSLTCLTNTQGVGSIELAISGASTQCQLSGGQINTITQGLGGTASVTAKPDTTQGDVGWWNLPAGDYRLNLTGLYAGTPVVIQAKSASTNTVSGSNSTGNSSGAASSSGGTIPQTITITVVSEPPVSGTNNAPKQQ